jgi:hypothetical protein
MKDQALTYSPQHAFAVTFSRKGDVGVLGPFQISGINDVLVDVAVIRDELVSAYI